MGAEKFVVIAVAIWLSALTLVILLVVRQIGLLTVRLSFAAPHVAADDDGPELGSPVPESVLKFIGAAQSLRTLVFLSATCSPCRTLASEMTADDFDSRAVVLIAGREEMARGVGELLPAGVDRLFDPAATQVASALGIESVPFGIAIGGGLVRAKAYLHGRSDLARLDGAGGSASPERAGRLMDLVELVRRGREQT